ncbi:MAG TPA: hypothetical protein VEH27_06865 [Methylomirabilota bacterium]|nr:hypothetical protein [Methylomirabilota bacterium]
MAPEMFPLRLAIYAGSVGLVFETILGMVKARGWEFVALEHGYIESCQTTLIALTSALLIHLARVSKALRPIFAVLAFLSAAAVFREFNNTEWYQAMLPPTVKCIIGAALVAGLIYRVREGFFASLNRFLRQPAAFLFVFGFMVVTVWAQTLARKELFPFRQDRLLEEALELAGYTLILCGIVEAQIAHWLESKRSALAGYGRNTPELASARQGPEHSSERGETLADSSR